MENPDLSEQIAELRRETRSTRRWVIFTAFAISILLFFPSLWALLSNWAAQVVNFASANLYPAIGILVAVIIAAFVVSHFISRPAAREAEESQSP
jgi:uncharacterized membrane protein (DUF485 family)